MKIEWTYLPQPHIYLSRLVPQQLADSTWVLMVVPVNGEHTAGIGSHPIPDNPGHVPYCGDDGWVWVRRGAPELKKDNSNPLVVEMERRCTDMLLVSQAVVTCADVFEQACEPRPPKVEWLQKWPYWQVLDSEGNLRYARIEIKSPPEYHPGCECCCGPSILCRIIGEGMPIAIDPQIETVMPVTGEGPTIPVGWKVVGE